MNEVKISAKNGDKGLANLGFQDIESETNGNEAPYLEILEENPVQKSHFGRVLCAILLIALITWLVLDVSQRKEQLVSLGGFCVLVFLLFLFSKHPMAIFLNYTTAGSSFVFGEKLIQESFAFQLSWLLQITMGTAATESLSVVGNIFVGMIDASSLIAASVMAAPCALAMAKLVYPEVETSKFQSCEGIKIACGEEKNILEAAGNGASVSVGLVANIAANLIAFLAVLAFINAALSWLGGMVNLPQLSFQLICSYVLMPLAFLLGASWEDASLVAEMVGIKFFLNEFVAYQQLSTYKSNRLMGLPEWDGSQKQWISVSTLVIILYGNKSLAETILTFALCGFANLSSIGIMLGGLTSMAPQRKSEFSSIVLRALITGATVSLINACIAGILYVPRDVPDCLEFFSNTIINSTSYSLHECCKDLFGRSRAIGKAFVMVDTYHVLIPALVYKAESNSSSTASKIPGDPMFENCILEILAAVEIP
ncbi:hypothetical protein Chor_000093 [Crotalus horridus]